MTIPVSTMIPLTTKEAKTLKVTLITSTAARS